MAGVEEGSEAAVGRRATEIGQIAASFCARLMVGIPCALLSFHLMDKPDPIDDSPTPHGRTVERQVDTRLRIIRECFFRPPEKLGRHDTEESDDALASILARQTLGRSFVVECQSLSKAEVEEVAVSLITGVCKAFKGAVKAGRPSRASGSRRRRESVTRGGDSCEVRSAAGAYGAQESTARSPRGRKRPLVSDAALTRRPMTTRQYGRRWREYRTA